MISTKGRYSIRILLDLAEHRGVGYTPIKDVAARQSISLKYVEKLMPALKNAGLLDSSHGIGGGYRLNRDPEQYDLWASWPRCPACKRMPPPASGPGSAAPSRCGRATMT